MSTLQNYSRSLAKMGLYFNQCPTLETDIRIKTYLIILRDIHRSSYTSFKFCIYGLRYAFLSIGQDDRIIKLPSIKRSRKLPVILSKREVKLLLKTPQFLKQRILFATIYSCGLRLSEVVRLKQSNICFDRMTVHISESKYKKERIVPLSKFLKAGLQKYYAECLPKMCRLFKGRYLFIVLRSLRNRI
jgi:integrase/recombinase XerD